MVILLEGADGAGKSTLYEKLKKLLPSEYEFIKHLDRDAEGHRGWWDRMINRNDIYVIDRGFISELVYRPIKRDKVPNVSLDDIASFCNENLLVVYCKTTRQLNDMLARGDDYVSETEYPEIVNNYNCVMSLIAWFTDSNVYTYDWAKDDITELVNYIRTMVGV